MLVHLVKLGRHVIKGNSQVTNLVIKCRLDVVSKITLSIFKNSSINILNWLVYLNVVKDNEKDIKNYYEQESIIVSVKGCYKSV